MPGRAPPYPCPTDRGRPRDSRRMRGQKGYGIAATAGALRPGRRGAWSFTRRTAGGVGFFGLLPIELRRTIVDRTSTSGFGMPCDTPPERSQPQRRYDASSRKAASREPCWSGVYLPRVVITRQSTTGATVDTEAPR